MLIAKYTKKNSFLIPFLSMQVPAGFPSPADDHIEQKLDLNELMVKHPAATFFVRAHGDSMENAGIRSGDILVVDRALPVIDNSIVIAVVDGELLIRRLEITEGKRRLVASKKVASIDITNQQLNVWGVVTYVIHNV